MLKKIGILGSGKVGQTLANGLQDLGYTVGIGSRAGGPVNSWNGTVGTFADIAATSDIIVLAVKGTAAQEVISGLAGQIAGKIVIDTTNPIADTPPEDGVLHYFTTLEESLMERLQTAAPEARFIKAFNSVGSGEMIKPAFDSIKPTMFICGDDDQAKKEAIDIIEKCGWEVADMGGTKSARAIEPLCMLWCLPGMLRGEWSHAFKLLHK